MAAKPIERFVKKQIQEQGGWPRILERLASGETVADIARSLKRPDGVSPSRNFVSMLLHADPVRSQQVKALRPEQADALVEDGLYTVDRAPIDRDSINKAKVQAELRLKVAGFLDRTQWGEAKQAVHVAVNVASLHVDALRHRIVEASRPLAGVLAKADGSPAGSEGALPPARETSEPSLSAADRALAKDAEWLQETPSQQLRPSNSAA